MLTWTLLHPRVTMAHLGYIPGWLIESDPRPAKEQLNERYKYGGWQPFDGFKMVFPSYALRYPGDPDQLPIAKCELRDEVVLMYQSSWVAVVQKDGAFEVCRMD